MKKYHIQGFSMVEILISISLALVMTAGLLILYISQTQIYKTTNSQANLQSAENAILNLVVPVIRAAGFGGCNTFMQGVSILNASTSKPLSTFNTVSTMISGYDSSGSSVTVSQNAANSSSSADWTPTLDPGLVGQVEKGSDVVVVLGPALNTYGVNVTNIDNGSTSFSISNLPPNANAGQIGVVSDCVKSVLFQITSASSNAISHAASGTPGNNTSVFPVNFQAGAQFIPIQQMAFFVGQGTNGQSSLMRAVLNGTTWTTSPIVPGVDAMIVRYGIGSGASATQYVPASAVTNWAQVYSVRIGFVIQGEMASGGQTGFNPTQLTVLNVPVNVPSDNRLRHPFEIFVNIRNALL